MLTGVSFHGRSCVALGEHLGYYVKFDIPKAVPLPKTGDPCCNEDEYPDIPYVIVGDDAFQLSSFVMKPYSSRVLTDEQLVFNYRLSRFRRVSENAFGFLNGTINKVILSSSSQHVCEKSRSSYILPDYVDHKDPVTGSVTEGQWRNDVPSSSVTTPHLVGCRGTRQAEAIRNHLSDFFNGPGALPWQENILK